MESVKHGRILFGVWGIDPAVNISLQYAVAEGLIAKSGLAYRLTPRGETFCSKIDSDMAFKEDYFFLQSLGSKITEGMVNSIVEEWE